MINCHFDLTNMVFRSMFSINAYEKGAQYTYHSQQEIDELMRKLSTDIAFILRMLNPGRVSLCVDSKSWRKKIEIEENEGYKGQREKNEDINWDNIYKLIQDFCDIAEKNGFIISKINMAEADDNLALWSAKLKDTPKQHTILVSGDEDIRQLAYFNNKTHSSVTIFNPFMQGKNASKKLYHTKEFLDWVNTDADNGDIFNMYIDTDHNNFKQLSKDTKLKFVEIEPESIALNKIFCGDGGDNIPSFYTWLTTTAKGDEKETRITPSKYEKIINELNINTIDDLLDVDIVKLEESLKKIVKGDLNISVRERLNRQCQLVILRESMMPEVMVDDFNEHYEEAIKKPRGSFGNLYMQKLLEGTRYMTYERKPTAIKANIFNTLDGLF